MALAELVDVEVIRDWEAPMPEEERPLVVAYDIRDLLANIQRGVDSANSALALKADKTELAEAKASLHGRIDHLTDEVTSVKDEVAGVKEDVAQGKGWRDGVLLGIGLAAGLVGALVFYIVTH